MKKKIAFIFLGCLIGYAMLMIAATPSIPHSIEGKDCISCHGASKVRPYPKWHAERNIGNTACTYCHRVKSEK